MAPVSASIPSGTETIINTNFNAMLKGRDPLDIQGILATFGAITVSTWPERPRSCSCRPRGTRT
jgi:hypothetical protein